MRYTVYVCSIHCTNSLISTLAKNTNVTKSSLPQNAHLTVHFVPLVQCICGDALGTFKCAVFFSEMLLHFVLFQRCEFLWIFDGCARAAYRQSEDGGEASGNPAKVRRRRKSTKIRNIRKLGFRTFYKIIAWP